MSAQSTPLALFEQPEAEVQYREIPGFPGYRVSNDGSVWSRWRRTGKLAETFKRLNPSLNPDGYLIVHLRTGRSKGKVMRVHVLVLLAFVGPRPNGMESRHFPDNTRTNNRICNLSWATHTQNVRDCSTHGTHPRKVGIEHPNAKLTDADVLEIRRLVNTGMKQKEIAKMFGIQRGYVSLVARRVSWRHVV